MRLDWSPVSVLHLLADRGDRHLLRHLADLEFDIEP